jgi:hypothetical protein
MPFADPEKERVWREAYRKTAARKAKEAAKAKAYRERHKERLRAEHQTPEFRAKMRAYRKRKPRSAESLRKESQRARLLRANMSPQLFERLYCEQKGLCAICSRSISRLPVRRGDTGAACADHCHRTGRPRGLLCRMCNLALGYLNDSPELCILAAAYVVQHA